MFAVEERYVNQCAEKAPELALLLHTVGSGTKRLIRPTTEQHVAELVNGNQQLSEEEPQGHTITGSIANSSGIVGAGIVPACTCAMIE